MTLGVRVAAAAATLAAIDRAHPPAVFASSFGAEDMMAHDLLARQAPAIGAFTLDTGRLPEETLGLIDRARDRYGLPIDVVFSGRGRTRGIRPRGLRPARVDVPGVSAAAIAASVEGQ
jgi:3'-phosphoadenosine 5'-phosphosulfate sulfotransferase (PAPS reductase)/FAD synthetase